MKKYTLVALLWYAASVVLLAQDNSTSADTSGWATSLVGGVSLTQASYSNWSAGGENTVAYKISLNGSANRISGRIRQTQTGEFAFGQSRIGGEQTRKIDDLLRYNLNLEYLTETPFAPLVTLDARTQLADGFDYDTDPEASRRIATFLSPALIVETVGVRYEPRPWFKTSLGLAAKQTVVTADDLRQRYNLEADQSMRAEAGLAFHTLAEGSVMENVVLRSELDLFQAVLKPESDSFERNMDPDVRWKNILTMKVNDYLNVNGELELFYDKDLSTEFQVRQTLALGFALTLL